jgi:CRP-like cAMP-binding protein
VLPFAVLPPEARDDLAAALYEERYDPGTILIREGDLGRTAYLLVEGEVEVTTDSPEGRAVLATLSVGALFGELALLLPTHRRQATVTALTPVVVLTLPAATFQALLDRHPLVRRTVTSCAEALLVASFLKRETPFSRLDMPHIRSLAARLKPHGAEAGTDIIRQGQQGNYACYLLRRGRVGVFVRRPDGQEEHRATLEPGTLFGEAALVREGPRSATVRALEPCELLVLHRPHLLAALRADRSLLLRIRAVLHYQDIGNFSPLLDREGLGARLRRLWRRVARRP